MPRCTAYQIRSKKQKIGKSQLSVLSYNSTSETEANELVQLLKTQTYKPVE